MALLTLVALFFSFDFAVVGAALLIRAFIASNDQVRDLRAAIPQGTTLNVNRHGAVIWISPQLHCHSFPRLADITTAGEVSAAVQGIIGGLAVLSAYAVLNRSKTRPKFLVILGSLLSFASIWLLAVTIAFTVIFATKSARVSAFLGSVQLSQSIVDAQARALGVSPVYKNQSYRESYGDDPWCWQCAHAAPHASPVLRAAILPWFTWLFTTIAAVSVLAESRTSVTEDEPLNDKSATDDRRRSTPSIA